MRCDLSGFRTIWGRRLALGLGLLALASGEAGAAERLKEVTLGLPGDSLGYGTLYIAQKGGLFEQEGLKVIFNNISADVIPAALTTGDIFAAPLIGSITRAKLAGYKLTALAVFVDKPPFALLAKKEINSVAGLKGKVIISGPANATPAVIVKFLLESAKLSPQTDVQLLPIGPIAARMTMMRSGQADALIASGSDALDLLERMDNLKILVPPRDMPPQLIDGIGVATETLERDPETIRRLIRALAKANDLARRDPDQAGEMLADFLKKPGLGKPIGKMFAESMADSIVPTPQLYQSEATFASIGLGRTITAAQIQSAWNTKLAEEVERELKK